MIRFDNGPPDGDYVRYIDALMAERAATLVSATMSSAPVVVDRARAMHARAGALPSTLTSKSASTTPASASLSASAPTSSLSPTAANAIASAMMTRTNQQRDALAIGAPFGSVVGGSPIAPSTGPIIRTIAIVIGAASILIGIVGTTSNFLFIAVGIALVSWALKRRKARG